MATAFSKRVYGGETHAKRIARLRLYQQVQGLWRYLYPHYRSRVLVLTGDDAAEYGGLRWLLNVQASRVVFCDKKPESAKVAHQRWPQAETFRGDIRDALDNLDEELGFLNLDLCGGKGDFDRVGNDALVKAGRMCAMGGVVAYSFIRGREGGSFLKDLQDGAFVGPANRIPGLSPMDENRFCAYSMWCEAALGVGRRHFERVFMCKYDGGVTPMGVVAFQRIDPTNYSREHELYIRETTARVEDIPDHDIPHRMRVLAFSLFNKGYTTSEIVGDILNVNPGTIAAWKAHETRGTYNQ